jgi:hypothetical protein
MKALNVDMDQIIVKIFTLMNINIQDVSSWQLWPSWYKTRSAIY